MDEPTTPKLSVLEETKKVIDDLKKEKEEIFKIKSELEKLRSDQLLSGTAGGNVPIVPVKEQTAKEYAQNLIKRPYGDVKLESND